MYNYDLLRGFIRTCFGNQMEYAKFLGIGVTALYERLTNKVNFSQEDIFRTKKKIEEVNYPFTIQDLFFDKSVRKTEEDKKEG